MSAKATAWACEQKLMGRKKQLLLAIARAVDETGACRSVTQDELAASCACTVRQVRRLVGELAAERYLAPPPTRAPRWRQGAGFVRAAARGSRAESGWIAKCPLWSKTRANRTFDAATRN
jgi:hypothetical protein